MQRLQPESLPIRVRNKCRTSSQMEDVYGEASVGAGWQFREKCSLRLQYAYSRNNSNIDIYDFNRYEVSSTIRCDMI